MGSRSNGQHVPMPRSLQKFQGIIPAYHDDPPITFNSNNSIQRPTTATTTNVVQKPKSPLHNIKIRQLGTTTTNHFPLLPLFLSSSPSHHSPSTTTFSLSPPVAAGTRLDRLVRNCKLGLSKGTFFLCGVAVFAFGVVLSSPSSYSSSVVFGDMEVSEVSPKKTLAQKMFGHKKSVSDEGHHHDEDMDGGMELMEIGAERTKNVLILMSDTGGGHRASAEAIRDAFQIEFGDEYRIFVKDVWKEYTGWPLNDMEGQYKFMVKHVQLWNVAFHSTSPRWIHSLYLAAMAAYYAREVEAGLMEVKPDIIISVHPLMQHIPLWVLKWQGLQKKVIFVTVITDLTTCHPTWFHPWVNRCYCPSQEVAKKAAQEGLKEDQIRIFGLPIRPSFARAVLVKDELRAEFEMDPNLPAVLLMGGGEGFGPVKKTAKALAEALYDKEAEKPIGQIVIICGRNKSLASTLESLEWKVPVKIRGFETQMAKWMGACDCIITKAGPGTISEALIRGLPIILNDYIPGQEKGNVPYVVDNGAGVFTRSSRETARIVAEWFSTKSDELKRMSENALNLAQPEAVFDIVRDINELAQQREPAPFPYELTASFTSII